MVIIKNIVIKKNDAMSSLILFLFSSFLLPKGITKISLKKIFEFIKPFNKTEPAIRMGLSRAVKSGILNNTKEGNKVYYEIKENGLKTLEEWKKIKLNFWERVSIKRNGWNNYWCIVISDIPGDIIEKKIFLDYLKSLGFEKLNKESFIHPYNLSKSIELKTEELKLNKYVNIFLSRLSTAKDASQLANTVWDIDSIKKEYSNFVSKYQNPLSSWNTFQEEELISLCHNIIYDFTEIMKIDPVLPSQFMGINWEGENVVRMLDSFNKTVVPKTKEFVNKIINMQD